MTDNLIEVVKLRKEFGGLVATNDVDFTIPRGSIVSLIGPNGAGKTTFFNQLTGVYKPTSGSIVFDGVDVSDKPPHAITAARHRPHLPEHPALHADDRARERARRHALPPARRHPRLDRAHAEGQARGGGGARQGARAARLQRPAAAPRGAGRVAALRRPAPARGRARARHRPEAAAARRADGRHEPAGDGATSRRSSAGCATRRA